MGLNNFKTDSNALSDGIWIDLPANKDGSIPAVRLRGYGDFNEGYTKALRNKFKPHAKVLQFDGASTDRLKERLIKEVICEYVISDWRNMQPEDDGNNIAHSVEAVTDIVFNPDYRAFVNFVIGEASDYEKFNRANLEATAKN